MGRVLDFSARISLAGIALEAFARLFNSKYDKLDVVINNGGPIIAVRGVTEDRFESHFGINHLGHFMLSGLLLELLHWCKV